MQLTFASYNIHKAVGIDGQLDLEEWDRVIDTNLRGVYYMIRAFVPMMQSGAHIVNISSLAGKNALPNGAVYAAPKCGLNGLSYPVAEEIRGQVIPLLLVRRFHVKPCSFDCPR